jgi:peptidoglycan/xylan/chitin deacetylase (PgdA/CDA1 family)
VGEKGMDRRKLVNVTICCLFFSCLQGVSGERTEIQKWQDGKASASCLIYDDAIITQFRVALPLMRERKLPATFFVNSGKIVGSKYAAKFNGRPFNEILAEAVKVPTGNDNIYERTSALLYSGYLTRGRGPVEIGRLITKGKQDEAYRIVDQVFGEIRTNQLKPAARTGSEETKDYRPLTWDEVRSFAAAGYEFGTHTISHAYLPALDEANFRYEIEKCQEELANQLGSKHSVSLAFPNDGFDERIWKYAIERFPFVRCAGSGESMPMDTRFLEFVRVNMRGNGDAAGKEEFDTFLKRVPQKEYVMTRLAPRSVTPLGDMKRWLDSGIARNACLLWIFHGVEGIGFEPLSKEVFEKFLDYVKANEGDVWVATFQDVMKYMRERMYGSATSSEKSGLIEVDLKHTLDTTLYDLPLTLKSYVPSEWQTAELSQGSAHQTLTVKRDNLGAYVLYRCVPNRETITLRRGY